jgi:hypothetical protein
MAVAEAGRILVSVYRNILLYHLLAKEDRLHLAKTAKENPEHMASAAIV